ncbi:hypothetical protein CSB69_4278 [Morganella morganii]|nr:hypothetical protein CSB69_4278 [Morganella morganii]EMP51391.1 hypothetical protein C790_01106 [Morganella morganii SC01]
MFFIRTQKTARFAHFRFCPPDIKKPQSHKRCGYYPVPGDIY